MIRRRFVNLVLENRMRSTLHRINPWRCFYPTTEQALSSPENSKKQAPFTVEEARLPRAAISFYDYQPAAGPENQGYDAHLFSLGTHSNGIISMGPDGNTFLYDGGSRGLAVIPSPHAPKCSSISVNLGDGLYILETNPGSDDESHSFEALIHRAAPNDDDDDVSSAAGEKWFWRSLPPPPYAYDGYECDKVGGYEEYRRRCYERNGRDPFVIRAYAAVGDSQIWISTRGGGTFSFDTARNQWSEAGDWALPFYGSVEYVPELGLWFGFTAEGRAEGRRIAVCDLAAASPTSPPVIRKVWDEFPSPPPPRWAPEEAFLLPLGGGRFCVARLFDLAQQGWVRGKSGNDFMEVDSFLVLTGVEVVRGSRGALSMIRHKSIRYNIGCRIARLL